MAFASNSRYREFGAVPVGQALPGAAPAAGALVGTFVFPGLGTAAGAAIGGLVGLAGSVLGGGGGSEAQYKAEKAADEAKLTAERQGALALVKQLGLNPYKLFPNIGISGGTTGIPSYSGGARFYLDFADAYTAAEKLMYVNDQASRDSFVKKINAMKKNLDIAAKAKGANISLEDYLVIFNTVRGLAGWAPVGDLSQIATPLAVNASPVTSTLTSGPLTTLAQGGAPTLETGLASLGGAMLPILLLGGAALYLFMGKGVKGSEKRRR